MGKRRPAFPHFRMTHDEKYYFDLNGYTVVPNVLDVGEIERLNRAVDNHSHEIARGQINNKLRSFSGSMLRNPEPGLGRQILEGLLWWPSPDGDPFRDLLVHPATVVRLNEICGPGFRLDSAPFMIGAERGADGDYLHGGGAPLEPSTAYRRDNDLFLCGSVVVLWPLTDANEGDGGFAIVPGSHKSSVRATRPITTGTNDMGVTVQPAMRAGDMLIFAGSALHGTLPWTSAQPRRVLLYKYSARTQARAGGLPFFPERLHGGWVAELSAEQRAVMYGPAVYYGGQGYGLEMSAEIREAPPILESDGRSVRVMS
jgi:hypothetical protein